MTVSWTMANHDYRLAAYDPGHMGRPEPKPPSRTAAYLLLVIGAALLLPGLLLLGARTWEVAFWPRLEGRVLESRLLTEGERHRLVLTVEYPAVPESIVVEPAHDLRSEHYAAIAEAVERYPPGGTAPLLVSPADPRDVRLLPGGEAFFLGAVLAGLGAMSVVGSAFAFRAARAGAAGDRLTTIVILRFVGAMGLVFAVAGAALVPGAVRESAWPVVAAHVESRDVYTRSVRRHKGGSRNQYVGRLYLVWERNGKAYRGALAEISDADREDVERHLASITAGARRDVHVDPDHPYRMRPTGSRPFVLPVVFSIAGLPLVGLAVFLHRRLVGRRPRR